jgi:hypothetical protein
MYIHYVDEMQRLLMFKHLVQILTFQFQSFKCLLQELYNKHVKFCIKLSTQFTINLFNLIT